MSFSSHRGCLYTCTKCLHVYIYLYLHFMHWNLEGCCMYFIKPHFQCMLMNGLSMQIFNKHFFVEEYLLLILCD